MTTDDVIGTRLRIRIASPDHASFVDNGMPLRDGTAHFERLRISWRVRWMSSVASRIWQISQ